MVLEQGFKVACHSGIQLVIKRRSLSTLVIHSSQNIPLHVYAPFFQTHSLTPELLSHAYHSFMILERH